MKLLLIATLIAGGSVFAECNYSDHAPLCPDSGSTLLDDTYPSAAYSVSLYPIRVDPRPMDTVATVVDFNTQFVYSVLEGHNFSPNSPKIFVSGGGDTFKMLKQKLLEKIKASNGKIPESVLDNVIDSKTSTERWQQDKYENFFNPSTGKPVSRPTRGDRDGFGLQDKTCGIENGPSIASDPASSIPGMAGGNIEGLPGGLCLVGKNQSAAYTKQFCGNEKNIVQVDTSWLKVGHVDEIAKVVPNRKMTSPKECGFALMVASPRKAYEILSTPAKLNQPFFVGPQSGASEKEILNYYDERYKSEHMQDILQKACNERAAQKCQTPSGAKQAFLKMKEFLLSSALAGSARRAPCPQVDECRLDSLKNSEFAKKKVPEPGTLDDDVQKIMDKNTEKILNALYDRLPQCQGKIEVIEVPNLYMASTEKVEKDEGTTISILPNPTNAVMANDAVIFPEPENPAFKEYLQKQTEKLGLRPSFVDSWNFAHVYFGNVHCVTNRFPYCKPRSP